MLSLKLKGRSLKRLNSCREITGIPSASCSRTEHFSASTLNLTLRFFLNCRTGKPKTTGRSSDGEPLLADKNTRRKAGVNCFVTKKFGLTALKLILHG